MIELLIGIIVLFLGIPIGDYLKKNVDLEEIVQGKKWFGMVINVCLFGGVIGLIFGNDPIMFSLFFIAIVTSRSAK
jgi:hypothetical protein